MRSIKSTETLEQRVAAYLKRRGVPEGAGLLVGFSGGPDSRALLEILQGLAASYPLGLAAAHLDHGLRPQQERAGEAAFVKRCCRRLRVPLVQSALAPGSLAARARREHRSLEDLAREARYSFLGRAMRETCSDFVALGHNLDDHLETLVMRFFQGSGLSGLRGIPDARGRILRPLRSTARVEIESWLGERGLESRLDSTNLDLSFLRNAVRYRLLPAVAEIFPGYRRSLLRLSRTMGDSRTVLAGEARRRLRWRPEPAGWSIDSESFFRVPYALRRESLFGLIDRWGPAYRRLPERFLEVLEQPPGHRRVLLSGRGMTLRRRGRRLFLERDVVGGHKKGYFIPARSEDTAPVEVAGLSFFSAGLRAEGVPAGAPGLRDVAPGLVFRSAQPGDEIGTKVGSKPVRKFFSEWKIPQSERWRVPVADSRRGVLAVLGKPLGYANLFRSDVPAAVRSGLSRAIEVCGGCEDSGSAGDRVTAL